MDPERSGNSAAAENNNTPTNASNNATINKSNDKGNSSFKDADGDVKMSEAHVGGGSSNGTGPNRSSNNANASTSNNAVANGEKKSSNGSVPSNSSKKDNSNNPPPPVMRGTLSYNTETRKHIMRGMWNYENSNVFPPQRFELLRTLRPDENVETLPLDGEFHGSFSLAYLHTTSKGKQKERSKVVQESGVKIKFTPLGDPSAREYTITGKGTNQFGIFHINGTAKPSDHEGDPVLHVEFRKRYEPSAPAPAPASVPSKRASSVATTPADATEAGPLPEPSKSYDTGVVCLRGKIIKQQSQDLGATEMVHRITGYWSSGLNLILADPANAKGFLSKFEYEHKSMVPTAAFPVSGKYSGWFDVMTEDGSRTRINESNVTLKFRKNNAGYYNVEGKGSNVYGKYSITGTLTSDNVITIFRHFLPRKIKASKSSVTPPPTTSSSGAAPSGTIPRRASSAAIIENPTLTMEDVKLPPEAEDPSKPLEPIGQLPNTTYSAVSQGVLKMNDDGSHSCSGKWAVTREHLTNGQTSPFTVRLDALYVKEALSLPANAGRQFPLDCAMYKGSFQLKKTPGRYQTIVDQQVVMRFRKNSAGSYNVYGKGTNAIGTFNLTGTLIMNGKAGHVELYRMYPPAPSAETALPPATASSATVVAAPAAPPASAPAPATTAAAAKSKPSLPPAPPAGIQRRESTRTVKLPSRLEDDDPSAQLGRIMDRCLQILRVMREKDVEMGGFFSEPVDPVALGIPTYHQIIKEPMDLKTLARKMEANEVESPEDFARLLRLIFENAMKFNVDPAHSVHQAARNLLILFNQKFRDVERMIQTYRRTHGEDKKDAKGKKGKKQPEKPKTVREIRLEEAQTMAAEQVSSMAQLMAAAPANSTTVSRAEFSLLVRMIQQMQSQIVQQQRLIAQLSPDEVEAQPAVDTTVVPVVAAPVVPAPAPSAPAPRPAPAPEKKKAPKRKAPAEVTVEEEPPPVVDDSAPLTYEEQELLTSTINGLEPEQLVGVIQIIREAAPVGADEDEIDMDIDQLSNSTQRKLLRHVSKFVKKPKNKAKKAKTSSTTERKGKGGSRRSTPVPTPAPAPAKPPAPAPAPAPAATSKPPAASTSALFGLDDKDDSDSDSDNQAAPAAKAASTNKPSQSSSGGFGGKEFKLSSGLEDLAGEDDDDEDDEEEDGEIGGFNPRWSFSKTEESSKSKAAVLDDDAWNAARKSAEETKAFEEQRKAREEKMKAEAEQAKQKSLADAAKRGEELRAQRQEEEAREAALREQKEKEAEEARQKARDATRQQVNSVGQTVDLDAQRKLMEEYEKSIIDMGGSSPASEADFGF